MIIVHKIKHKSDFQNIYALNLIKEADLLDDRFEIYKKKDIMVTIPKSYIKALLNILKINEFQVGPHVK